uniref:O-methyltransferase n=1 Tax=Methanococcus maripaludis (strain C6 / ATCC BAA-1332) TaxID=444158 RepID=A9AAD5_METM6
MNNYIYLFQAILKIFSKLVIFLTTEKYQNSFPLPDESPEKIDKIMIESYFGAQKFYLLKTALELKIFDYLSDSKTSEELSSSLDLDPVLTELMLKSLYELGIISIASKNGETHYINTDGTDNYLKTDSKYSKSPSISASFNGIGRWVNLSEIMNGSKSEIMETVFFPEIIKRMANDTKAWELQKTVEYVAKFSEFKSAKTLLDVAGGHGLYGISLGMLNENLDVFVFDLPEVTVETKKFIEKYDAKNVDTIAGNFFTDEFGENYDVIFSSYNPGGKNPKIAEKVYRALKLGGIFVTKQAFPRLSVQSTSDNLNNMEWNFNSFNSTGKGIVRYTFDTDLTFEEYVSYLEELGFEILETKPVYELIEFNEEIFPNNIIVAKKIK